MTVTIKVRETGPYLIDLSQGEVSLIDHEGNPIAIPEGKTNITLCRCGASTQKPFCDGTHTKIGFLAAEAAQRKADAERAGTTPR